MGQQAAAFAIWHDQNKHISQDSHEAMGQHLSKKQTRAQADGTIGKLLNRVFRFTAKRPFKIRGSARRFSRYGMAVKQVKAFPKRQLICVAILSDKNSPNQLHYEV